MKEESEWKDSLGRAKGVEKDEPDAGCIWGK